MIFSRRMKSKQQEKKEKAYKTFDPNKGAVSTYKLLASTINEDRTENTNNRRRHRIFFYEFRLGLEERVINKVQISAKDGNTSV
jgi:hypothetical protein